MGKMKLGQFVKEYGKWFHMFGHSYFDGSLISNGKHDIRQMMWNYALPAVLIVLSTFLALCAHIFIVDYSKHSKLGSPVAALNATTHLLTIVVAIGQTAFRSAEIIEFFSQIRIIDQMKNRKLSIDVAAFRRSLLKQYFLVGSLHLIGYVLTCRVKNFTWNNSAAFGCLFILRSSTVLIVFHMLFYIDLFHWIVRAMMQYVGNLVTTNNIATLSIIDFRDDDARYLMREFNFIKYTHLHLWEMSQTLNNLFGWTLVFMCLHNFQYAINCAYVSVILTLSPHATVEEILRNPNDIICFK